MVAFLQTNTALNACTFREGMEDSLLTPQTGDPDTARDLTPRIIVKADDRARHRITVIRELALMVTIHCNSNTDGGDKDDLDTLAVNLETLVDAANLRTSLTDATLGIEVMMANRQGVTVKNSDLVRERTYTFDVRAVPIEMTQ